MTTFARFILVGLLNSGLGYGLIFFCMLVLGLSPFLSNFIGYAVGLCLSFALHRSYTFRSSGRAVGEFARFLPVFAICYLLNLGALYFCIEGLHMPEVLAQLVAAVVYVSSSFVLNRVLVFGRRRTLAPSQATPPSAE